MSDKYYRGLRNIINDTKYKLQLASINLKINENKNSISGIKNDISEINNFSDKINDNETNISDNLEKINDIENQIKIVTEPYNETFILQNRLITSSSQVIFEKKINFDFSKGGFFNILTTCNYEYNPIYNLVHSYRFYNDKNEVIKREIIPHNIVSNVVKDEFKFESIDTSSLKIEIYLADNSTYARIKLSDSSLQFKYSEIKFKITTNEDNIKSNLKKINDNSGLINTNIKNISSNTELVTDLKNNSIIINDIYDETFIFSNRTTSSESQLIFKKTINFDFSKGGFFNILTTCNCEYDTKYNFNHSYHFYNDNNELFKKEDIINNMISNVVKDDFKIESIDTSSLQIILYINGNSNNETIKLTNSSLQFKYTEIKFKTNINENNIKLNFKKINDNSGLISTISSNSSKLSNLDIDVKKDIYKEIFNIENFETTSNFKLIFEKQIDFKFTKTGVIKIKANYEYLQLNNSKHRHIYIFQNNGTLFKQVDIDHYSKIVNDEFSIPSTIESENIDLLIYSVNPFGNNSKITLNKNSIEFIYNDFTKILKTDYNLEKINTNEGNISSNKGLIDTNTSSISDNKTLIESNQSDISDNFGKIGINTGSIASNLEKINDNKDDIVALQTSNVKAFYNLDQIFIYDIEKRNQTVNKNNHFHIFEKEITYNFTKNSYLEIALKILTKLSNYVLIGFFSNIM